MCHEGNCDPVESPCWSRLLAGPVAHGEEPMLAQFAGRSCDHVGDPHWSSLFLTVAHGKNPLWISYEGLYPMEGTPCWSMKAM